MDKIFGGARLGGVSLPASGLAVQNLQNLPEGAIENIDLTVTVNCAQNATTGGTFTISTGASMAVEGDDDVDRILAYAFSRLSFFHSPGQQFFSLTPAQLRTVLALLNLRDFTGSLMAGGAFPATTAARTIRIRIPFNLFHYNKALAFAQGSELLRTGEMQYDVAASGAGTVTTKSGAVLAISSVSVQLEALTGSGTSHDVAPMVRVDRPAGLPSVYRFHGALRLALLDTVPSSAATTTQYQVGDNELLTPESFDARYLNGRLAAGGANLTARACPLIWIEPERSFLDVEPLVDKEVAIDALGSSSLTVFDVRINYAPAGLEAAIATKVGGGSEVSISHPSPHGVPPGSRIPPALGGLLVRRISSPVVAGPGHVRVASPQAAAHQAAAQQTKASVAARTRMTGLRRR